MSCRDRSNASKHNCGVLSTCSGMPKASLGTCDQLGCHCVPAACCQEQQKCTMKKCPRVRTIACLLPCRRAYCSYADALFPPLWMGLVATLATLQLLPLWQVRNICSPWFSTAQCMGHAVKQPNKSQHSELPARTPCNSVK